MTARNAPWYRTVAAVTTAAALGGFTGPASAAAITFHTALPVGEAPLVFRQAPEPPGPSGDPQMPPVPEGRPSGDKDAQEPSDRERTPHARSRPSGPDGR